MVRSGEEAIEWLDRQNGPNWYRLCLMGVRMSFGLPGGTPNAGLAWDRARYKHRTNDPNSIPRGVPVFWETSGVADHIALSLGDGWCLSNDARRRGYYDKVRIDSITRNWGADLQGWTEDLNGHRVYNPREPVQRSAQGRKRVRLASLKPGLKNADILDLQRALRGKGYAKLNPNGVTGYFGDETRAMVRAFQKDQGWEGKDADGIPGPLTCELLGLDVVGKA